MDTKKMPYTKWRECSDCGQIFESDNTIEKLCYECSAQLKKARKIAGKKRRWYRGKREE